MGAYDVLRTSAEEKPEGAQLRVIQTGRVNQRESSLEERLRGQAPRPQAREDEANPRLSRACGLG
jgi:hypothetical protein